MITQSTNANMIPGQVSPRVNVSQYDKKSRTLSFTLYNGSQPFNITSGMAVTIEGTKPDNTGFQYAMIATAGSNVVSISIEQQMTVIAGDVPCEIVVSNAGKRLASANFILVVEPAALNENTIISETELPLIEKAAELAENIAIYVTTIHEDALKAEGYAVGKQNGVDVGSGSEYFHNNAKYHKEQAAISATNASNAASTASNAASTATTKASQATSAASTATSKASEATTAAQTATTKASEASASAQIAQEAAESLIGEVVDSEPYVLRQGLGNLADMTLVGGSVAWNQLCNGSSVTVPNGHKYYMRKSGTTSIGASTGSAITGLTSGTDNVIDLTQLFGSSTIADYIYSLEQATAGAGVAWFRKYFPNVYYGYQSGKIESVNVASRKVVGFNQWDEEWELGGIGGGNGQNADNNSAIRSKNYIRVIPNKTYYSFYERDNVTELWVFKYRSDKSYIGYTTYTVGTTFVIPEDCAYIRFFLYKSSAPVTNYDKKLCLNISKTTGTPKNGDYEPYQSSIYAFDSSKQLRGIPKLVDNKLSYDGDIYTADGTVTRKYGIVDMGTLDWSYNSKYAVHNTNIISSLLTADSVKMICSKYTVISPQDVSNMGSQSSGVICKAQGGQFLRVKDTSYSDAATFKTAMSGVYLVYELATPTTESANPYQNPQRAFSDGTEEFIDAGVTAGTRDVSIPVGNNTTYQLNETLPPTEDYVDGALKFKAAISALGTDESGRTTASRAYTAGEFFYKDGKMYKVLTSIAQGATFTINTNCQQTTLFAELKALAQ